MPLQVIGQEEFLRRAQAARRRWTKDRHIFAMYNSTVDAIVTDEALMSIPINDQAIVRGHALFDTCSVANGRLYRLDVHLDRMFDGARRARIPLPFPGDEAANRRRITEICKETVAASGQRDGTVRYYLTAGPGVFGLFPDVCETAFYLVVFSKILGLTTPNPVSERTVHDVPMKHPFFATIKSNNYMPNVLTALSARDRGGRLGILIEDSGKVAESCVMNVVSIGQDGVMRTPKFEGILNGTTVRRVLELAKEKLVPRGMISGVAQCDIMQEQLKEGRELFLCAGDTHVVPIKELDGVQINEGKEGPVAAEMQRLLLEDACSGEGNHHTVEYPEPAPQK
eukprot:TRINITY_DN66230_c0_g1_i1.p1 TRINITY_DN66230_c0_g1~~TRINITY_DN66230_c0_g1_i1.p1  ORF type:complete len:368 (+),score=115.11 TRINITY_DN66230_c0_g1_i1:85-1104(+)